MGYVFLIGGWHRSWRCNRSVSSIADLDRFVPLPKSVNPERIKSNADVYDFELDAEDMKAMAGLDEGAKGACSWNPVNDP